MGPRGASVRSDFAGEVGGKGKRKKVEKSSRPHWGWGEKKKEGVAAWLTSLSIAVNASSREKRKKAKEAAQGFYW